MLGYYNVIFVEWHVCDLGIFRNFYKEENATEVSSTHNVFVNVVLYVGPEGSHQNKNQLVQIKFGCCK